MPQKSDLKGIICAVVTPLRDGRPDLVNLQQLVTTLRGEGVDGILLLGTTGEGPSFSVAEREAIILAAKEVSGAMTVHAGTGFASLTDTIDATRRAFEIGVDSVVVIPPYYYKKVTAKGLATFYKQVLDAAVPDDGLLMLYHIPAVTGIPISHELIDRLLEVDEKRLLGVKDSSNDLPHGQALCHRYPNLRIFLGTDHVLLGGLEAGAAGCITAGGNVLAPLAVQVYRTFSAGQDATAQQALLSSARGLLDQYQPSSGMLKSLLALRFRSDGWETRPPLENASDADCTLLVSQLGQLELPDSMGWLRTLAHA
jgi:4-hydroxy-tetrahydrodipicolinate synthase